MKDDVEINSQFATMRDDLSIILFNTQHLIVLGQNERYSSLYTGDIFQN